MSGEAITLPCNRCGECCKVGTSCLFRKWNHRTLPYEFDGRCELLTDCNECTVMREVKAINRWDLVILFAPSVVGTCDFPHLRIEEPVDGDYQ